MEPRDSKEIQEQLGRFPFALAVTAIVFSGVVFILFNGPVLLLTLSGQQR